MISLSIAESSGQILARSISAQSSPLARQFLGRVGLLLDETSTSVGVSRFFPPYPDLDVTILDDRELIINFLEQYLAQVAVINGCYTSYGAAYADLRVFRQQYFDRVSLRALQTLLVGLANKVDVTLPYLRAIEALSEGQKPVQGSDTTEIIYWKHVGDSNLIKAVTSRTTRPAIKSWSAAATDRQPVPQAAADLLTKIWEGNVPFDLYDPEAPAFQVGRKRSGTLSGRIDLDDLALAQRPLEQQSAWLTCVGVGKELGKEPVYYRLLAQGSISKRQRLLEQVSLNLVFTLPWLTISVRASSFSGCSSARLCQPCGVGQATTYTA